MTTTDKTIDIGELAEFLTDLYGLDITGKESTATACAAPGALATYVTDEGEVRGHILCDVRAAAVLGAALTQIPKGGVDDAISSGQLPDNLRENIYEVLNISVNVFPHVKRLVLRDVEFDSANITPEDHCKDATAIDLSVARYGDCTIFVS
ncbi:MAG: hypothetical protein AAFX06_19065 [Planctomycetota bacterium]